MDCVVFNRRSCCFSLFGFSVCFSLLIIVFFVVNKEKSFSCTEITNLTIFSSSTIRLSKNICLSYNIFVWLILWTYFFPPLCKIGWHPGCLRWSLSIHYMFSWKFWTLGFNLYWNSAPVQSHWLWCSFTISWLAQVPISPPKFVIVFSYFRSKAQIKSNQQADILKAKTTIFNLFTLTKTWMHLQMCKFKMLYTLSWSFNNFSAVVL